MKTKCFHKNIKFLTPLIAGSLVIVVGSCFLSRTDESKVRVGIQPFGDFSNALTDSVSSAVERTYAITVYKLPIKPIPEQAFTNIKTPRYRADKIIAIIKQEKPDTLQYVLALTNKDISTTKRDNSGEVKQPTEKYTDWGIFGLGYRPGPSCVVSTFRLNKDSDKFVMRLKKVSVHEFGHNLGLPHCTSKLCVMRDAVETIATIDMVNLELCERCKTLTTNK